MQKSPLRSNGDYGFIRCFSKLFKGSTLLTIIVLKNENIMANIVTAKVISQKGSCGIGHKVGDEIIFTEDGVKVKYVFMHFIAFSQKFLR